MAEMQANLVRDGKGGQIKWKNRDVRLSNALWGQEVGLEPVGEGRWAIHFEGLRLGVFDERKGRVERSPRLAVAAQEKVGA